MPPSPPPTMSARDQQAANHTAALSVLPAKSKSTSRKQQQSNADESAAKCNKTVGSDSDVGNDSDAAIDDPTIDDASIAVEEANDAEKGGKKGKKGKKTGTKGKTCIYFIFLIFFSFSSLTTCSRKMWADCQHEDKIENAKGTPAHLQPCVF